MKTSEDEKLVYSWRFWVEDRNPVLLNGIKIGSTIDIVDTPESQNTMNGGIKKRLDGFIDRNVNWVVPLAGLGFGFLILSPIIIADLLIVFG